MKPIPRKRRKYAFRLLAISLLLASLPAFPQAYPVKPVRIIVPFAPAGAADTVARAAGNRIGELLGQPVIIENRPGALATIGSDIVAKAAPDGYTLLIAVSPPHTTTPFFVRNPPFDSLRDFTPIAIIGTFPQAITVHPSVPAQSLKELIDYVKKNPGKVAFGTSGVGTAQHLGGLQLNQATGMDMLHIGYKGGAPAVQDHVGGQVPVAILTLSNVINHVRAGRLRFIAMLEGQRAKGAPEVPTVAEAGVPGFATPDTWIGLIGPARLPAPLVRQLGAVIARTLESPDVRARLEGAGFEIGAASQETFADSIARGFRVYQQIVNDAGIRPE